MENLFKDLTAGFSTFVLSWLVPSAVVVAIFSLFIYPPLVHNLKPPPSWLATFRQFLSSGALASTAAFALAVVILALVASLGSRPLYRLLEGYTLPPVLGHHLRRKQLLRRRRLLAEVRNARTSAQRRGIAREELSNFPVDSARVLPTRLGNALKALETYGSDLYKLDSQTFWYEIYGSAPDRTCNDADQARASVDFFISLVGLFSLLSLTSLCVAIATGSTQCWVVGAMLLIATRPAYSAAVRNMTDWRYAVQALINLARPELAKALGYRLPDLFQEEQDFWDTWSWFVGRRQHAAMFDLDQYRQAHEANSRSADFGSD